MRRLLIVICLLVAAYSGYWALGRAGLVRALDAGEVRLGQSVQLTYANRATSGYPSRFDTTWRDVTLAVPGLSYRVPLVQVFALSYRPNRAILFAPGPHDVMVAGHALRLETDDSRASVQVVPGTELALDKLTAQSENLSLLVDGAPVLAAQSALAALHRGGPPETRMKAYLEANSIDLGGAVFDRVELDAVLDLDTRATLRGVRPRIAALSLHTARISAGESHVALGGKLTVDGAGQLQGELSLTGTGWQRILELAVEGGLLEPGIAQTWRNMGETLSGPGALDLTLPVRNGRVLLGPVPIVILPQLAPPR